MSPMPSTHPLTSPFRAAVLLGVSTVASQALLLREAMAAMGGSETAWGMVMALWLVGVGAGARAGVGIGSPALARVLAAAVLVLCGGGVLLFRAAPAILAAAPGETLTTWHGVWLWAVAVLPTAMAGGLAFPILAGELGSRGPGRAYTLDAAGSLAGGLVLSFVLLPFGTAAALLTTLAVVTVCGLWPVHRAVAATAAAVLMAGAVGSGPWLARATWSWSGRPGALGEWAETRHQRLEVSTGDPTALHADGRLVATYPEPYLTLPRAHLIMLLHPSPRRVLAVGCLADGSLDAMVRHPVAEIIAVEEDPQLIGRLATWYGTGFRATLRDPRVTARAADPVRVIEHARDLDLVILNDADPTTLRANRTRTLDLLRSCRRALADDGILVMGVGVGDTYLGGVAGDLLATLTSTLRAAFPQLTAVPGDRLLLVAGNHRADLDVSLQSLTQRRLDRPEIGDQLHPEMLSVLLDEGRQTDLAVFVDSASRPPNTIDHPRAVHLASRIHEARSRLVVPPLLGAFENRVGIVVAWLYAAAVLTVLGTAAVHKPKIRAVAAASVIGLASMGWWLVLLATWQATRGSVYAEVGALTGAFMAGVAIGCGLAARWTRPRRALPWLLGGGVATSLMIASGLPVLAPLLLVPTLLIIGGALTGGAFPGLAELAGAERRGAGLAFAADEAGAALAALTIGTAALPWFGMTTTALGLAGLGLAALPAAARR